MNEEEVKNLLLELQNGQRNWTEIAEHRFVFSMMEHIGSTDADFRDELIYQAFWKLIDNRHLSDELMIDMLNTALSDIYLFDEIGGNGVDSVFKRSNTALLIALLLNQDLQHPFLTEEMIGKVKDKLVTYLDLEEDIRGYVTNKGWAHSVVNTAYAIDELVKNPYLKVADYDEIFQSLVNKIFTSKAVYISDEDERVIIPIFTMLENGLSIDIAKGLFERIPPFLAKQKEKASTKKFVILQANCKKFLKSFYYIASTDKKYAFIERKIVRCLKEIS
ncbi:DUF2785 domain-containing protein [Viridibacillus sp. NPDC096237]|uniref:DUF2785 domain-containing protein n=1 Tax=Viridibacillus sp. NPDC096237 TaxID=3390721 RepID=UPI003CFCF2AE